MKSAGTRTCYDTAARHGESIYKVGRLLGDTVKTVETVYGHYSPEFLAS
jgi:hypothetical protein